MNKPHSPLPWVTVTGTTSRSFETVHIQDNKKNDVTKEIYFASDAEYLTWAANNMQEAVELLKFSLEIDDAPYHLQIEHSQNIKEFLTKIESEY